MTVSSDLSRISTDGNGATTVFSLDPMTFFDEDTLSVALIDEDGTETIQSLTTHYTVTGGGGETGAVVMITPPATGQKLIVGREEPILQGLQLSFQNALPSPALEAQLDKIVMMVQRLKASSSLVLNATLTAYDALSRRITNVAPGIDDNDVVTLAQVEALTIAAGNVPTPTLGDNGKVLGASGGTFDWQAVGELPVPADPGDDDKALVASGGTTSYRTLPVAGGGTGASNVSGARTNLDVLRLGLIAGVVNVIENDRTLTDSDRGKLISMTTGAADREATLPDPATVATNWQTTIKKADADDQDVRILTPGAQTIDGHPQFALTQKGDQVTIASDGSNYHVISASLKPVTRRFLSTPGSAIGFTPGRNYVEITCVGGGGAGGGTDTTSSTAGSEGSGGGGGQTRIALFPITTSTISLTVGTGGNGDDGNGDNGTNTSAGGLLVADGGFGGDDGFNDANETVTGGAGGNAGSVDSSNLWNLKINGGSGGNGVVHGNGTVARGYSQGHGGGSHFSAPALSLLRNQQQQDSDGFGQGGAGSSLTSNETDRFGGDGGNGLIILVETY